MALTDECILMEGSAAPAVEGARVLIEACGVVDFRTCAVLVPGRRARRLFNAELVRQSKTAGGRGAILPPLVVTPSALIESFFARASTHRIASLETSQVHWLAAIRGLGPVESSSLVPGDLDRNSADALSRVQRLRGICDELDANGLTPAEIPDRCTEIGSPDRWHALDVLRNRAHALLDESGLVESTLERRRMIEACELLPHAPENLFVLGVPDPGPLACHAFDALAGRTRILVDAAGAERSDFDAHGRPVPTAWNGRTSPIEVETVRLVDRPIDAAEQVLDELALLQEEHGPPEQGQVVVGLCDESLLDLVQRAGRRCGAPLRASIGRSMDRCELGGLLVALERHLHLPTTGTFGGLLRVPCIESLLNETAPDIDLVARLDAWRMDRVGGTLEDLTDARGGRGKLDPAPLVEALAVLDDCITPMIAAASTSEACVALGAFLERVFTVADDDEELAMERSQQRAPVAELLQDLAASETRMNGSILMVVRLCLDLLSRSTMRPDLDEHGIEVLGWLELRHDPAADVVLVGVNESGELAPAGSDGWLPDSLRSQLGMFDDGHRRARDAHAMHLLHARCRSVRAIITRKNIEGDLIAPSRLFLGAGGEESASRICMSMDEHVVRPRSVPAHALAGVAAPAPRAFFNKPEPPAGLPVTKLRVTDFASWIRSPLRYWLERIEGASTVDTEMFELDPLAFGILAHDVIQAFSEGDDRDATDPDVIQAALSMQLERLVARRYGAPCAPAIALQKQTLLGRLHRFASIQAREALNGWRMHRCECLMEATLDVPEGAPVLIRGRIDRIDRHEDGRLRVLDFKTSDKKVTPASVLSSKGIWHDLQLPLYHLLVSQSELDAPRGITLGYVSLCGDVNSIGIETADWDDAVIATGIERAREIVREMRSGTWPDGTAGSHRKIDAIDRILRKGVLDIACLGDGDDGGASE